MTADPQARRMSGGRIVMTVVGSILGLFALALVVGGGAVLWADHAHRDSTGYFTSAPHSFRTGSYAITREGTHLGGIPKAIDVGKLAHIRIRATNDDGRAVFVGIARDRDLDAYLAGVAHARLKQFDVDPFNAKYEHIGGSTAPARPASQRFWVASATGEGAQTLDWRVHKGTWAVVVMNADASRGVNAHVKLGAKISYLGWLATGLLVGGALLIGLAVLLLVLGLRGPRGPSTAPVSEPPAPALPTEPVAG